MNDQNEEQQVVATPVAVKVNKVAKKRGPQKQISFAGIRWDRMTDKEAAKVAWENPDNQGLIRTKNFKNFVITTHLKRKKLVTEGRKVEFGGRVVVNAKGEKVKKTKWVRAKVA